VPVLLVLVTFLFWYQTWFGRRLSDRDLGRYLADTSVPHQTQHALSQLADRMARGDASARKWYPQVIRLAERPEPGFRVMAAWAMGQDNKAAEFHAQLLKLIADPDAMVRRNAALALVRFGDASGRPELRAMLQSVSVSAPVAGTVKFRLKEGEPVEGGVALARVQPLTGDVVDVVAPVMGVLERRSVADGATVATGDAVAVIAPGEDQVWEALRALYLVGRDEELPDVERYARGVAGYSERIRQQAAATAAAIRQRAEGHDFSL
jgi:HEAT repeat protein